LYDKIFPRLIVSPVQLSMSCWSQQFAQLKVYLKLRFHQIKCRLQVVQHYLIKSIHVFSSLQLPTMMLPSSPGHLNLIPLPTVLPCSMKSMMIMMIRMMELMTNMILTLELRQYSKCQQGSTKEKHLNSYCIYSVETTLQGSARHSGNNT
jgi:hypothetical protein